VADGGDRRIPIEALRHAATLRLVGAPVRRAPSPVPSLP
jgi:hypothetical protein